MENKEEMIAEYYLMVLGALMLNENAEGEDGKPLLLDSTVMRVDEVAETIPAIDIGDVEKTRKMLNEIVTNAIKKVEELAKELGKDAVHTNS